ncbi:type-F conjugative transfer system pilin assembly thiol-disulfide isomerase TrbB, partial [Escherichia coli]|nr:type-F conjugative transfer system pilin assembly thiol-disulfide isomerase TrbB [Escherichia coli]
MFLTKSLLFTLLLSAAVVQGSTRDEIERLWSPQGMA